MKNSIRLGNLVLPLAQRRHRRSRSPSAGNRDLRGTRRARSIASRSRLVAAMMRTSTVTRLLLPSRLNSPSCSTCSSLACSAGFISPISSSMSVPPSACSNLPTRSVAAPVNAPFSWPNSSLSSRSSGSAAQFTLTNGRLRRDGSIVNRARDEFLADAALAANQHGDVAVGHAVDDHRDRLHRVAVPQTETPAPDRRSPGAAAR